MGVCQLTTLNSFQLKWFGGWNRFGLPGFPVKSPQDLVTFTATAKVCEAAWRWWLEAKVTMMMAESPVFTCIYHILPHSHCDISYSILPVLVNLIPFHTNSRLHDMKYVMWCRSSVYSWYLSIVILIFIIHDAIYSEYSYCATAYNKRVIYVQSGGSSTSSDMHSIPFFEALGLFFGK